MINELVTGDTAAGDTEAKRVPQRGTSAGAALVHIAGMDGDGITIENVSISTGTDSDGNPLPAGFDTLAETYTYENGSVKTIAKTSGANTYTQTFTYSDGQLTGVSQWVKS